MIWCIVVLPGISFLWRRDLQLKTGVYTLAGKQCDNTVSRIMEAGGRGYKVRWRPKASFEHALQYFGVEGRSFGK